MNKKIAKALDEYYRGPVGVMQDKFEALKKKHRKLKKAARTVLGLAAREAWMRKEYPAGSCNAEDAWHDFAKEERAAWDALRELSK